MARETAVVIAPGRGTYNAGELGYLQRWHHDKPDLLTAIDDYRTARQQEEISNLDRADRFSLARHARGKNAAGLIYGCALGDFLDIDRDRYDIVAVTGNSMGWYLSLAAAGVVEVQTAGVDLVETMAALMDEHGVGGQLIYPLVDDNWGVSAIHQASVEQVLAQARGELFVSIRLGGSIVLAGTDRALRAAEQKLPKIDGRFPLRLAHHSAFHTPLLEEVGQLARQRLPRSHFGTPELPLIDGRGEIWQSWSDLDALREYTLGHQVVATYDFSRAIEVALKEFAPQRLIILGPGTIMGPPVLQILINHRWLGLRDKASVLKRQESDPFVLAMGIPEQREMVRAG
ncbi:MAG: ACP S-malonyltransferase [Gammaproteobacteria bacterium]|nr:ACP S-malonyltransferase [Gammaproteobacteria bacterium]